MTFLDCPVYKLTMRNVNTITDRQRGRPREFDVDHTIERAMQVFWTLGYQGTSLPDLMQATGLSRGSLYAAFGDKHGLFLLALDHYIVQALKRLDFELASGRKALAGLKACMDGYVERTNGAAGKRGCLVVATAMELAAHDHEVSNRIAYFFRAMETRLANALKRAQKEGDLGRNVSPEAAAHVLVCFLEGLRVVRKTGIESDRAKDAVQTLIRSLAG
ncbi:TetR/AcrR family transcriptional regulator [Paraburkholderia atlantica]|uniref:TetR/AcrR family transcriptional regulator n=1 Tax=Paraburkholderia atlantica TaxID=2654982 RepID=UPI001804A7AF|nr:TetR/AcrR family transcriptional regulator [Paraburkholderia atlantica]MBB5415022.1 TetR/AcrR family transcriptional repressor of nem operon [Paraburkholderia atlantica]